MGPALSVVATPPRQPISITTNLSESENNESGLSLKVIEAEITMPG